MAGKWDRPTADGVEARRRESRRKYRESQREYDRGRGRGNGAAGLGAYDRPRGDAANCEIDYSDEEREFLVAVDRWKAETGVRFPTLTQLLAVLKGLGYRRVVD